MGEVKIDRRSRVRRYYSEGPTTTISIPFPSQVSGSCSGLDLIEPMSKVHPNNGHLLGFRHRKVESNDYDSNRNQLQDKSLRAVAVVGATKRKLVQRQTVGVNVHQRPQERELDIEMFAYLKKRSVDRKRVDSRDDESGSDCDEGYVTDVDKRKLDSESKNNESAMSWSNFDDGVAIDAEKGVDVDEYLTDEDVTLLNICYGTIVDRMKFESCSDDDLLDKMSSCEDDFRFMETCRNTPTKLSDLVINDATVFPWTLDNEIDACLKTIRPVKDDELFLSEYKAKSEHIDTELKKIRQRFKSTQQIMSVLPTRLDFDNLPIDRSSSEYRFAIDFTTLQMWLTWLFLFGLVLAEIN